VWWYLFRTDEAELHWAVIGWGVSVVGLAALLGNIDWTLWHFEGREGYARDIIEKYSEGFGLGTVLVAVAAGIAAGELVRAFKENSVHPPSEPSMWLQESAPDAAAGAAAGASGAAERREAESSPSAFEELLGSPAVQREAALRIEARRAVAGSEELTRKLEVLLAQRDDLLRHGQTPEPVTARELLARVFDA
jgi:hypothetical protein